MKHNDIYLALLNRIVTKVPEIQFVDWFNQQKLHLEEDEAEELPFNLPAVLIEFLPTPADTFGRRIQLDQVNFRLLLITETFEEHSSLEDETTRNRALSENELGQLLINALIGYNCENFGSIAHQDNTTDHDYSSIKGPSLSFKMTAKNTNSAPATETAEAGFKVTQGRCY